jgi:SAM-dependent methyltransferase
VLNLPYTSPPSRYDEFGRPCFGDLSQIRGLATKEHRELTARPIADGYTTAVTARLVAELHALVRAHVVFPCDMLEIGGGRGKLFDGFANALRTYINVEPDPVGAEGVQRLAHPKYQLVRCSAEAIPLPDGSVDAVLSMASLDHVPDTRRALREMHRLLRPGGHVLIVMNNRGSWWKRALGWTPSWKRREALIAREHFIQWSVADASAALGEWFTIVRAVSTTFVPFVPRVSRWLLPAADRLGAVLAPTWGGNMLIVARKDR